MYTRVHVWVHNVNLSKYTKEASILLSTDSNMVKMKQKKKKLPEKNCSLSIQYLV